MPEGFELVELTVLPVPDETYELSIAAFYQNDSDTISIAILQHEPNGEKYSSYEKNSIDPDIYVISETEYYFFTNNNKETVAWDTGTLECTIHTTLSQEELQALVNSMYER